MPYYTVAIEDMSRESEKLIMASLHQEYNYMLHVSRPTLYMAGFASPTVELHVTLGGALTGDF